MAFAGSSSFLRLLVFSALVTDLETARYLLETMPDALKAFDESEVADQLLHVRQKKNKEPGTSPTGIPTSLEELVTEAVVALLGTS